ncbi:MAG: tyrosine-type recombinase/integrase [Fimbriiglobus sp.]
MGRQATNSVILATGERVGYSLTDRPGGFRVRFVAPDGKRVELATGSTRKGDARAAAEIIILRAYQPPESRQTSASWQEALADLDNSADLRPDSIRGYRVAVEALLKIEPTLKSPNELTLAIAHRFAAKCLSTPYQRGHASDAKRFRRSPTSVNSYLRSLKSLWGRKHWGRPGGFVTSNPWDDVAYLNAPRGKRVRTPEEDTIKAFMDWLQTRYPDWVLPRLFVTVKMLAGCRTMDLCLTLTRDLVADGLILSPEATKTREARKVPLPADVLEELKSIAGKTWLWERAAKECQQHRPSKNTPPSKDYSASSWRHTIENLFREFNATRPLESRLRPHDLRARAMTLVAAATQSVEATAQAMGVDAQTARHYLDAKKAFDGSAILRAAQEALRCQPKAG